MSSAEAADLQIDFLHGYHGDGYPFDGVGGAVGHAFFPSDAAQVGGVHLDAEEKWAFRQPGRTMLILPLIIKIQSPIMFLKKLEVLNFQSWRSH